MSFILLLARRRLLDVLLLTALFIEKNCDVLGRRGLFVELIKQIVPLIQSSEHVVSCLIVIG